MPRRGENIYKRKDGRWEARYIYSFKEDGSPRYRSIYAADYLTVKKKQNDAKRKMDPRLFQSVRMKKNISFYGLLWLERLKPSSKESTYVRYHYLFSHYISPMIGDRLVYTFSNKDCEIFLNRLLVSGKSDGSGLAPKTVTDIRSVVKLVLKTAEKEGELSLCNPELCPVKPVKKPLRILSLKEQQALQDYLLGNLTHKNIGTLIALYTGVRLGELCAMQWKDIHFQEQYLEISKTLHRVKDHTDDSEHNTKIIITPPKTESSIRNIPIPDFLFEILQQYVQSHKIDPEAYILTGKKMSFREPRSIEYYFKKTLKKCQIEPLHFHCLRHTFATRCVELGFDMKTLSEILGHSNINTTLNRYVHPSMEQKQQNIDRIAKKYGLKVIYDAAHAFAVKYKGVSSACFGDASMFSFHATKVFNTIEGGCVCFKNDAWVQLLNDMKNFGIHGPESVQFVGGNAKMNEFQAAMGICNLKHLNEEIAKRKNVVERYRSRLEGVDGIKLSVIQKDVESNYAYFPVVFDGYKYTRNEVFEKLAEVGIGARKYFYPLTNSFECYRNYPTAGTEKTPIAQHMALRVLTLPLYADLSLEDVDRICDVILG